MMKRHIPMLGLLLLGSALPNLAHSGALLDFLQTQGINDESRAHFFTADALVPESAYVIDYSEHEKINGSKYLQVFWQSGSKDLDAAEPPTFGSFIVDETGIQIDDPSMLDEAPLNFFSNDEEFEQAVRTGDSNVLFDVDIQLRYSGEGYYKNPRPRGNGSEAIETTFDDQGEPILKDLSTGKIISATELESRMKRRDKKWARYWQSEGRHALRDLNKLLKKTYLDRETRKATKQQIRQARKSPSPHIALTLSADQILLLEDNQDLVERVSKVIPLEKFELRGIRDYGNTAAAMNGTNSSEGITPTIGTSKSRGFGIGVYQIDDFNLRKSNYNNIGVQVWPLGDVMHRGSTDNHSDHVIRHAMRIAPDATYFTRAIGESGPSLLELGQSSIGSRLDISIEDLIFAANKAAPIAVANASIGTLINRSVASKRGYLSSTSTADGLAYKHNIVPVFAAGNSDGKGGFGWEGSSQAGGFNVISVGAMDYRNGRMADFTPVRNAPWLTRKPDTYAPGVRSEAFTSSRSRSKGERDGSSFAAPLVTGGIASLMADRPYLRYRPFEVRAMALAGAVTRVTSNRYRESSFDGFSLNSMADTGHFRFVGDTPNWFRDTRQGWWWGMPYRDVWGYFIKGKPAKVALAWDVDPQYALAQSSRGKTNIIGQDFDVVVYDSGMRWLGSGQNTGDSKEIVKFTPKSTGWFRIRIMEKSKNHSDGETRLGVAWNQDARVR